MKDLSIYIHIPFCKQKCNYCSFVSFSGCECFFSNYFNQLKSEIESNSKTYSDYCVQTIFIGGGTPSVVNAEQIKTTLDFIYEKFNVDANCEISIEVNPESITKEKLAIYSLAKINRISVGVQTLNDNLLKAINRPHVEKRALEVLDEIKQAGFSNINADVMLSLPNQKLEDVKSTLNKLVSKNLTHISIYSLIIEENTPIYKQFIRCPQVFPSENDSLEMFRWAKTYLEQNGYNRYEVANFSKENYECKHNLTYWNLGDYVGFGLSAYSKIGTKRFNNTSNLENYLSGKWQDSEEELSDNEIYEEQIMLGLRTTRGIRKDIIRNKQELAELVKTGFLIEENGYVFAGDLGFEVLNQIIIKLV